MSIQQMGENVVITAQQFNPSIINSHWLINNGVILENELVSGAGNVFVDPMTQLNTPQFISSSRATSIRSVE
jgi:hypothetical protein